MNILSFKIQSLIHINAIIIFLAQFLFIISEYESPKEITDNYIPIIHLLDGQTFKYETNEKILICSFDSNFSNNIKVEQKNILCLIKGISSDIELYVINNNTNNYTYKYYFKNEYIGNYLSYVNAFPYYKDKLKFVITTFNRTFGGIDLNCFYYEINDPAINNVISLGKKVHRIDNKIPIGNIILNKNTMIFTFTNGTNIFLDYCGLENNVFKETVIECKDCLDDNFNFTEISLSETTVTRNENQIFVCYKYPKFNSKCFFYKEKTENYTFINRTFNCKSNIKNYYFKETNEFAVVCKNGDLLSIYKNNWESVYSNQKFFYSSVNISRFACNNNSKNYVFYYNASEKRYLLEYDCFNKNSYNLIKHITEPKKYKENIGLLGSKYFINETLDDLLNHLDDFLEKSIYLGDKYIINSHNYNLYIRSVDEVFYQPLYLVKLHIDFLDCKYLITSKNNYEYLTLIIFEIYNPNEDTLNNKIEYKLFDENYEEVDTSICKNTNITINYTRKDNITLDLEKINNFTKFNVNLFNISDVFFQELCHIYSDPDFKYDIILKDRIDLYQNYYICDEGCFLKHIYEEFITCDCPFKADIDITLPSFNPEEIQIPTKFPKYYEIVKCAGLVFSSDDKINNLGFYLITFMLGGHMPIWCYYLSTSVSPIKNYITKEMTKYGYISKKKGDKSSKGKKKGTKRDENNQENAENVESSP